MTDVAATIRAGLQTDTTTSEQRCQNFRPAMGVPNEKLNLSESSQIALPDNPLSSMSRKKNTTKACIPSKRRASARLKRTCADYCYICFAYTGTVLGLTRHYVRHHYKPQQTLSRPGVRVLPIVYVCMRCQMQIFESKIDFKNHLIGDHTVLWEQWRTRGKRPNGYYVGSVLL